MIYLGTYGGDSADGIGVSFDNLVISSSVLTVADFQAVDAKASEGSGLYFTQIGSIDGYHGFGREDVIASLYDNTDNDLIAFESNNNSINHGGLSFVLAGTNLYYTGIDGIANREYPGNRKGVRLDPGTTLAGLYGYYPYTVSNGLGFSFWVAKPLTAETVESVRLGIASATDDPDVTFRYEGVNDIMKIRFKNTKENIVFSTPSQAHRAFNVIVNFKNGFFSVYLNGDIIKSVYMDACPITKGGIGINYGVGGVATKQLMFYDQVRYGVAFTPSEILQIQTEYKTEAFEQSQYIEPFHGVGTYGDDMMTQFFSYSGYTEGSFQQKQTLPGPLVPHYFSQSESRLPYKNTLLSQKQTIESQLDRRVFSQAMQVSYYNPVIDVKNERQPHDDYTPSIYEQQFLCSWDGVQDLPIYGGYQTVPGKNGSNGMIADDSMYMKNNSVNARYGMVSVWTEVDQNDSDKVLLWIGQNNVRVAGIELDAGKRLIIDYFGIGYMSKPGEYSGREIQVIMNSDLDGGEQRIMINGIKVASTTQFSPPAAGTSDIYIYRKWDTSGNSWKGKNDSLRILAYGADEAQEIIIEKDEIFNRSPMTSSSSISPFVTHSFSQKETVANMERIVFDQKQSVLHGAGRIFEQSFTIYQEEAALRFTQSQTIESNTETIIVRRAS